MGVHEVWKGVGMRVTTETYGDKRYVCHKCVRVTTETYGDKRYVCHKCGGVVVPTEVRKDDCLKGLSGQTVRLATLATKDAFHDDGLRVFRCLSCGATPLHLRDVFAWRGSHSTFTIRNRVPVARVQAVMERQWENGSDDREWIDLQKRRAADPFSD